MRGDLEWGTIPRLLADSASRYGDRPAIIDADSNKTLSFNSLHQSSRSASSAFIAHGIEPGDRVAIWAPNVWEWVVAALGLQMAGAVLIPLNTRFKGREAAYVLQRSRARILFTVRGFLDTDYPALLEGENLPHLERIVLLRGTGGDGMETWSEFVSSGAGIDPSERADSVSPEDPCDILFTSGTTGHPKGVICTHGQTLRTFTEWSAVVGLKDTDRYLVVNPFFHAFGYKAGWLSALIRGSTMLPHAVFDVAQVFARIPRDAVTMLPGPPALYQQLLAHPELSQHDLSSLRLAVTGASVIPTSLIIQMREVLGFETVITGYGLTESCGVATMCRFDDDPETIATTSGRAIDGAEVRVVDDDGVEVPRGEPGEIVVRGYNVMVGYLDDPAATAEAIDDEGWLKTGDIGEMDPRGYIRITDRKKDMFIVGGFNAYPAEIETLMLDHSSIAEVAVVGAADERLGEVGVAFVVPKPGVELTAEDIIAWSREHMANYKAPRRIVFVDALPRNALGKVTRFVLREQLTAD